MFNCFQRVVFLILLRCIHVSTNSFWGLSPKRFRIAKCVFDPFGRLNWFWLQSICLLAWRNATQNKQKPQQGKWHCLVDKYLKDEVQEFRQDQERRLAHDHHRRIFRRWFRYLRSTCFCNVIASSMGLIAPNSINAVRPLSINQSLSKILFNLHEEMEHLIHFQLGHWAFYRPDKGWIAQVGELVESHNLQPFTGFLLEKCRFLHELRKVRKLINCRLIW